MNSDELASRGFSPGSIVTIDTETTGLHAWLGDRPFAIAMCNAGGDTWYTEFSVDPNTREPYYTEWAADFDKQADIDFVRSIVENPNITKVGHNLKFDIRMLEVTFGIKLKGPIQETIFAARACNSLEPDYTLKGLAQRYCGVGREDNDELLDMVKKLRPRAKAAGYNIAKDVYADYWLPKFYDPESTLCQTYAELDVIRTMMLWNMYDEAMNEEDVRECYDREMALWQCTYDMETRGVRVNVEICYDEQFKNQKIMTDSLGKMYQIAGREINPNSTKQLIQICNERGLEPTEFTASGQPSMAFNAIRTIANDPFIHELQRFRASQKVMHTFIDKYLMHAVPDHIDKLQYCLHPMYNQASAQTGRFGCSHPNLQQVVNANGARNAVESMSARMAFGPRNGYVWYHFDYSQLELYLFAGFAEEEFMLHHMVSGHDLHAECANKAWGGKGNPNALIKGTVALELEADKPSTALVKELWDEYGWDSCNVYEDYDGSMKVATICKKAKDEFTAYWLNKYGGDNWDIVKAEKRLGKKVARTRAKFVMYAKIYGGGPEAIRNFLYCTPQEAKAFQFDYDKTFPRIKQYLYKLSKEAEQNGYITNPFGRKVVIPPGFYYKSVNFLVQSTAADLLKQGMVKTYNYVKASGEDFHMLMTIHDELVFECKKPADVHPDIYYKPMLLEIKRLMEDNEGRFTVPIPVEIVRCDARWDQKTNLEW